MLKKREASVFVVLAIIIAMVFVACDPGGSGNDDVIGETVNLDGIPVIIVDQTSSTDFSFDFVAGDITPLSSLFYGTPEVSVINNRLAISLDTPRSTALISIIEFVEAVFQVSYPDEHIDYLNPVDAKIWLPDRFAERTNFFNEDGSYSLTCLKSDQEFAFFMYADKEITIEGSRVFIGGHNQTVEVSMNIKQGWNYILWEETGGQNNIITYTVTNTLPNGYNWTVFKYN